MWGVANDVTNPMVSTFKKVMPELSNFQAALVQLAFYGGYGTMAIPAALFIRKYNFKSGKLIGLSLYAIGAILFWPAAVYKKLFKLYSDLHDMFGDNKLSKNLFNIMKALKNIN